MRDLIAPEELASNTCCLCGEDFTIENPCWNDEGTFTIKGVDLHLDGECKTCANGHLLQFQPTLQHERGE